MRRMFVRWGAVVLVAGCWNAEAPSHEVQLDSAHEAQTDDPQMLIETPTLEPSGQERAAELDLAVLADAVAVDGLSAAEGPATAGNAQQDEGPPATWPRSSRLL